MNPLNRSFLIQSGLLLGGHLRLHVKQGINEGRPQTAEAYVSL